MTQFEATICANLYTFVHTIALRKTVTNFDFSSKDTNVKILKKIKVNVL